MSPSLEVDRAPDPLDRYRSIGIILAGGGAKGAYQAGALAAIHEFLTRHNAHTKVRMIAGTSIGSWNALFWLSGLIEAGSAQGPNLEDWWSNLSVWEMMRPAFYLPALRNYFFSAGPWRRSFQTLFGTGPAAARLMMHIENPDDPGSLHFYFTRSNVERAQLEVTTNRRDLGRVPSNLPGRAWAPGVQRVGSHLAKSLEDVAAAVFSSMDLPPVFEYARIGDQFYEDGGVIDNLPIQFGTEGEQCDLLFVLPLNASFAQDVNRRSIFRRLWRVMDVRQGVLERNSFKMIYLYNELAALRQRAESLEGLLDRARQALAGRTDDEAAALVKDLVEAGLLQSGGVAADRALIRRHQPVDVFAVCPAPRLEVDTMQFWKRTAARTAFRRMRDTTAVELDKFFAHPPNCVRMALVQRHGDVVYLEEF